MKDKDSQLIWESLLAREDESALTPEKQSILDSLSKVEKLLPDNASVQWTIQNGSYGSVNAHAATPDQVQPDSSHYNVSTLKEILVKIWSDDAFAEKLNLLNADWSGEDNYSGGVFWTANDTHYQDLYGYDRFNRSQLKDEFKEDYLEFNQSKRKADTYVKAVINGKEPPPAAEGTDEKTFSRQIRWRISLSPRSEAISKSAGATAHAVYPKLYKPDGSRNDTPGGSYVGD